MKPLSGASHAAGSSACYPIQSLETEDTLAFRKQSADLLDWARDVVNDPKSPSCPLANVFVFTGHEYSGYEQLAHVLEGMFLEDMVEFIDARAFANATAECPACYEQHLSERSPDSEAVMPDRANFRCTRGSKQQTS